MTDQATQERNARIMSIYPMCHWMARRLSAPDTQRADLDDRAHNAALACLRREVSFKPARGAKYSTYLGWVQHGVISGNVRSDRARTDREKPTEGVEDGYVGASSDSAESRMDIEYWMGKVFEVATPVQWFVIYHHRIKERTLEQVGAIMDLSRERVRQIEAKAFGRMRRRFPDEVTRQT